jgi:hypothetical protein
MVYAKTISTPVNTAIASPLRTSVKAISGVIYGFEVYFPPGSSGLMGVKVWSSDVALFPVDRAEWFIGDNTLVRFDDIRELSIADNIIDIFTYNTDTLYVHRVQVRIGVLPVDLYMERYGVGRAILQMNEAIAADITARQDDILNPDLTIVDALSAPE